tara:strand:+ start:436 stop:675 length:240 start_codon:yes stop_codon:yes gene_type:complete
LSTDNTAVLGITHSNLAKDRPFPVAEPQFTTSSKIFQHIPDSPFIVSVIVSVSFYFCPAKRPTTPEAIALVERHQIFYV